MDVTTSSTGTYKPHYAVMITKRSKSKDPPTPETRLTITNM